MYHFGDASFFIWVNPAYIEAKKSLIKNLYNGQKTNQPDC
ncbi:hypothetical protein M23134_05270 [Microscilla marina ATCC 23134]|uniref:Uncharacterized protein n=1 Tax=Microscilla marina ATCC 23134 TaxID=313606 RepID=A1ZDM5_MICM2|nr:hypothetical protein M23134_05270 [Microscilla marina ATCC 23134]